MKYKLFTMMGVLALSAGSVLNAQDYDDIYYDGSATTSKKETKTATVVSTPRRAAVQLLPVEAEVPAQYKVSVEKNYKTERDVDEYNRRTGDYLQDSYDVDTLADESAFSNTKRIERFYNPDVVVASDDVDLIELYYDDTPANVNITIGTGYYPYSTWGLGWTSWYDPWYGSSWYYHNRLWGLSYYDPWLWPYGYRYTWYGWHDPWHYSGWGWGWNHHWGWDRPYWGGWYGGWYGGSHHHNRPFGGGHHYGNGRPGYADGGLGGRRPNGRHGAGTQIGNSHRGMPGSSGRVGSSTGSRRPGYATGSIGNVGTRSARANTPDLTRSYNGSRPSSSGVSRGSSRPGYATGSAGTRSYSGNSSGSSRSYSPSTPSRSYSGNSSSSSRSYGGGSYSGGGGSRSSGHSGGGFSGGGGRRR